MKLWLIYRNYYEHNVTTCPKAMKNAGKQFGIESKVFFMDYFSVVISNNKTELFYKNKKISKLPDAVFFRGYNFEVMDFFEKNNVLLVNSQRGMKLCRNKFETHKIASTLNILQPKTLKTANLNYEFVTKQLGKVFVMKNNTGQKGENVFLIKNKKQFLEAKSNGLDYICQSYIQESKGKDVRVYVIGNKILDCVQRVSQNGDFRSNICLGATSHRVDVPQEQKQIALKLSKKMGLSVCSVDFLQSGDKYYLCEVNGNSSFWCFTSLGYNVQKDIMQFVSKQKFIN